VGSKIKVAETFSDGRDLYRKLYISIMFSMFNYMTTKDSHIICLLVHVTSHSSASFNTKCHPVTKSCHPLAKIFGPLGDNLFPLCNRKLAKNTRNRGPIFSPIIQL